MFAPSKSLGSSTRVPTTTGPLENNPVAVNTVRPEGAVRGEPEKSKHSQAAFVEWQIPTTSPLLDKSGIEGIPLEALLVIIGQLPEHSVGVLERVRQSRIRFPLEF